MCSSKKMEIMKTPRGRPKRKKGPGEESTEHMKRRKAREEKAKEHTKTSFGDYEDTVV